MGIYSEKKKVFQEKFERLKPLILKAKECCVFTGAGVSTLSGIPDFRGAHGVYTDPWHGMEVEQILDLDFFFSHPDIFYSWAKDVWYKMDTYQPTIVHTTLAKMEKMGYLKSLYTQNVDMLHERAGSKEVYNVHGTIRYHHCTNCGKGFSYREVADKVLADQIPYCDECNHIIKPDIVFYGEGLDSHILRRAAEEFSRTDLCMVLGSSLTVQPAASFPWYASRNGAPFVIANAQPTSQDGAADLKFRDLEQLFSALNVWLDTVEPRK